MKKVFIVSVCATLALGGYAQEQKAEIPAAAKTAFAAKFPKATKVEWGIEKNGEYEAEFKLDGHEMSALYNATGALLEIEKELKASELPLAVKTVAEKELAGYKLDEVEERTDAQGAVTYKIEAKKEKEEIVLVVDALGKIIKKEVEKEDENKDEQDGDTN